MTIADRLVVMNRGVVEQVGTPTEVYDPAASAFIAGFIGSPPMNLLRAEVAPDGGHAVFEDAGRATGTVGFRPEDVERRPSDGQPALRAFSNFWTSSAWAGYATAA